MGYLLVAVLALWFMGFGLAMILQRQAAYVDATRRFIAWVVRSFFHFLGWIWRRWHYEIILMTISAGATLAILNGLGKL